MGISSIIGIVFLLSIIMFIIGFKNQSVILKWMGATLFAVSLVAGILIFNLIGHM
ncbi:hypothetical protein [Amphibacillus jilinensis]|uniref:hypothetical protein n=1 Tax=Amphibacillus jilinensis TaxID=1216008 RepID=UPI00030F10CC|nr:hypothetical protein [Amphibacillus jilinensis]